MDDNEKIYVTKAFLPPYEEYIEAIKPLWDSHWITNMGVYHQELEKKLKEYLEVPYLSLMVNGHMALEMAIQAFDFPEGAEVITTPFTFISTTHAIVRNRLTPVFCDVKLQDGTIDENKIEELITDKTVAIVPVHVYGNICNVEAIDRIANKHKLKVIYDAAHAFGEKYKGVGVGNFGDASVFSFHATKVFNTIEGGAVSFKEQKLYDKLYNLKNFGIRGEELVTEVGANAKMNEFSAIMGLCNLSHIEEILESRRQSFLLYKEKLSEIKGIRLFDADFTDVKRNYGYLPILVDKNTGIDRDALCCKLRELGIYARKYFYPIVPEQQCYISDEYNCKLKNAENLSSKVLCLSFFAGMNVESILRVVEGIREIIG